MRIAAAVVQYSVNTAVKRYVCVRKYDRFENCVAGNSVIVAFIIYVRTVAPAGKAVTVGQSEHIIKNIKGDYRFFFNAAGGRRMSVICVSNVVILRYFYNVYRKAEPVVFRYIVAFKLDK